MIHKENQKVHLCCLDLCALCPGSGQNPQPHKWHCHTRDMGISAGFAKSKGASSVHTSSSSSSHLLLLLQGWDGRNPVRNICWWVFSKPLSLLAEIPSQVQFLKWNFLISLWDCYKKWARTLPIILVSHFRSSLQLMQIKIFTSLSSPPWKHSVKCVF